MDYHTSSKTFRAVLPARQGQTPSFLTSIIYTWRDSTRCARVVSIPAVLLCLWKATSRKEYIAFAPDAWNSRSPHPVGERSLSASTLLEIYLLGVRALLSRKPHDLTTETLEMTQLCFIRKDDFLGFLSRNEDVSLRLAQKLSNELYGAYQLVSDVALKQSYKRLTELLLRLCQSHGDLRPDCIRLKMNLSQEELADMIGVSRRTLARALAKLKYLGIIECQRRLIIIRDRVALEESLSSEILF